MSVKTIVVLAIWLLPIVPVLSADSINAIGGISYHQILSHIASLEELPEPINLTASYDSVDEAYDLEHIGQRRIFARFTSADLFGNFRDQEISIRIFISDTAAPRNEIATICYCSCKLRVEEDLIKEVYKISYQINPRICPVGLRSQLEMAITKLLDLYFF